LSRSVTRATLIVSIPLLSIAVVALVGSHRPHSVVASRLTAVNVAFLRPRHAGVNDLARLVDDAPPPAVVARQVPLKLAPPRTVTPPVSTVGGAVGIQFSLVNQDRAANRVAGLRFSGALARVAQYRAQDMLNRGYFSHYDPSTGQLAFSALMHLWGIPYSTAGENIAWSSNPSMAAINTMFMASPEHRANILNGAYHQAGIGVAGNGARIMVVEVFSN
jgi:uncharacterized protein YkwD